ncbi:MAG: glycoside hydrolase family 65 protein [Adhaeribacter sp.]
MKNYLKVDEWRIIEEGFDPLLNRISESIFSLGNGRMGQRANFEETYSGDTLPGNYVAGVYYPDKTRVGWWKNGYPEYFAKVLNAANWIGIAVAFDGEELDLHHCRVSHFRRVLHLREGYLERSFTAELQSGRQVQVTARRFCSMVDEQAGAIRYSIRPLNFSGQLRLEPFIDGDVKNQDANYDEKFWDEVSREVNGFSALLTLKTRKTGFEVCTGMRFSLQQDGRELSLVPTGIEREKYVGAELSLPVSAGQETVLFKYAANLSSENHEPGHLAEATRRVVAEVAAKGFDRLQQEQARAWGEKWAESDIHIEGDAAAQQGIRFNIFQLKQTYTGRDARLNIGPKGFTGEKYGGSTYWDTEAYCVPFFLATASPQVTRNLLLYRYRHLPQAMENAAKLGFGEGAALYPMVTMNGEECHNEWEITFEEIHRNAAIAFAIYNYVRYTGDEAYLADYGLEVLVAICRFWAQRVNWSIDKKAFVMLGVTGPNEYENNVNNNWYTSLMAMWCLEYTLDALAQVQEMAPEAYDLLLSKTAFRELEEPAQWQHILRNMYLPEDEEKGIFLQQDGYLDKQQLLVADLDPADRPLNQQWSWDRILRSPFIKQADVLQGLYFLEDRFDLDTLRRNFDYYEPRTVHESSLSPCVHAILAARLGDEQRAYQFYLRTARLDLDDYNNDTEDGCHITSMAGTWMSVVEGFGGMRVREGQLRFHPFLPGHWTSFSFKVNFRGALLQVKVSRQGVQISNQSDQGLQVAVYGQAYALGPRSGILVQAAPAGQDRGAPARDGHPC